MRTDLGTMEAIVTEYGLASLGLTEDSPGSREALPELEGWLETYLSGKDPRELKMPLDLSGCTDFQRRIYDHLVKVPFGRYVSYKELGEMAGFYGSPRAVGGAVESNPILLVIPCHRVLAKGARNGYRLGGFSAGTDLKRRLLELEGVVIGP